MPKTHTLTALALAVVLLLCGCSKTPDLDPVWEKYFAASGVTATLANCIVTEATTEFWQEEGGSSETLPLITAADGIPYLCLSGVGEEDVTVRFATQYETGYRLYDLMDPFPKTDYQVENLADGTLQLRMDTVYNFWITVTTDQGSDSFVLVCTRDI